jgi:hypothetical protein
LSQMTGNNGTVRIFIPMLISRNLTDAYEQTLVTAR